MEGAASGSAADSHTLTERLLPQQPSQKQQQGSNSAAGHQKQQQRQQAAVAPGKLTAGSGLTGGSGLGTDAPQGDYGEEVVRSLQVVDPALINYELIEALVCHVLEVQQKDGPAGLLKVGGTAAA